MKLEENEDDFTRLNIFGAFSVFSAKTVLTPLADSDLKWSARKEEERENVITAMIPSYDQCVVAFTLAPLPGTLRIETQYRGVSVLCTYVFYLTLEFPHIFLGCHRIGCKFSGDT